ncbi:hypothetical protein U9M48_031183 [Paspalum notatum var. saurae]|uniref:Integrase zinc-binding domain-containing protein n=1 Tax=Paspalum notatum var. saurae TaxID=547442 RepID=A0AAQ3U6W7_PASNO
MPRDVKAIRSFFGLAGYYRRFIECFSKITKQMTTLLEKKTKFEWTPDYREAFEELKKRSTITPVLTFPDMHKPYSRRKSVWEPIFKEAHETAYSIHPGSEKIYQDLKKKCWYYGMKPDVVEYVALCDICQKVKAEHQRPTGLLQLLKISEWKWEEIGMDFIISLPRTQSGFDSIWVVASIKMSHFQALHGRRCRMPLHWDQPCEKQIFGLEIIEDAVKQVQVVRENLRIAHTRQKSYADNHGRDLEFIVGLRRFKVKGKLAPWYIGPFKIIDRKGRVAYQPELPDRLSGVHDVFHVFQLKKCLRILDTAKRVTRKMVIKMCKVKWSHHSIEEATREGEDDLRADYLELFC